MKTKRTDLEHYIRVILRRVHGDSETLYEVIDDLKSEFNSRQKSKFQIGDIVNIVEVQKNNTKKTTGVIRKINLRTADVRVLQSTKVYRVPFGILEK